MKIGVFSLTIGDEYKDVTKYGRLSKVNYCKKHNYDFIEDESIWDKNRPIPWSKILLLEKYISNYDYVVWMDGDTMIMNDDMKLEEFISIMHDKEFMATRDPGNLINTGVWFIKNTNYVKTILRQIYEQDESLIDSRYWEQGAWKYLYDTNWNNLQSHCKILWSPQHYYFNCTFGLFQRGDFLLHFLGIRNWFLLREQMNRHYPYILEGETKEFYDNRMIWFKQNYSGIRVFGPEKHW